MIDAALESASAGTTNDGLAGLVSIDVKVRIVAALFRLAGDPKTTFAARSMVTAKLQAIGQSQPANANGDEIKRCIAIFERDPERFKPEPVVQTPPGSPIGDDEIM